MSTHKINFSPEYKTASQRISPERTISLICSIIFIAFWLLVLHLKLSDFATFGREINNQGFRVQISRTLIYLLPGIWLLITLMLAFSKTRLMGMLVNLIVLCSFTVYVALALLEMYRYIPCSCAGLFHLKWEGQLYANLILTAVAATGFIFTLKDKERRTSVCIL